MCFQEAKVWIPDADMVWKSATLLHDYKGPGTVRVQYEDDDEVSSHLHRLFDNICYLFFIVYIEFFFSPDKYLFDQNPFMQFCSNMQKYTNRFNPIQTFYFSGVNLDMYKFLIRTLYVHYPVTHVPCKLLLYYMYLFFIGIFLPVCQCRHSLPVIPSQSSVFC